MKNLIFIFLAFAITGCSNAHMAAISAWGKRHDVKCYSGGILIYEGYTTGKIENEEHSDGYYFQDDRTGKLVVINANCLITVESR